MKQFPDRYVNKRRGEISFAAVDRSNMVPAFFNLASLVRNTARLNHKYLIYTRWCITHCGQAKIEDGSQALVDTEHDNLCILYCGNGYS